MPPRLTWQPAKVATPEDAVAFGQVSVVSPLSALLSAFFRVTLMLSLVLSVWLSASRVVTTGWVARSVPGAPSPGWVVKLIDVGSVVALALDTSAGRSARINAMTTPGATYLRALGDVNGR